MEELFTKAKAMEVPRRIVAGHDALDAVSIMCREFQLDGPALVVTGPSTIVVAGKLVADMLKDAGYQVDLIEVGPATMEAVAEVKERATEMEAEFLIGVGGGSKIDIAKLAAFEVDHEIETLISATCPPAPPTTGSRPHGHPSRVIRATYPSPPQCPWAWWLTPASLSSPPGACSRPAART